MDMEIVYNPMLIIASLMIAIVASFTALRITSYLRVLSEEKRKAKIVQGAFVLGGGIWSMHFVGMLSIGMPVEINYAPLPTIGSALIAILVVGAALLSLHFGKRTKSRIAFAGTLTGISIVSMHSLGMTAISKNCIVTSHPIGLLIATAIGIIASIAALEMAYMQRSLKTTIIGSLILGVAISSMHYAAIFYTTFTFDASINLVEARFIGREMLGVFVSISSFVICGLFLLFSVQGDAHSQARSEEPSQNNKQGNSPLTSKTTGNSAPASSVPLSKAPSHLQQIESEKHRIPYDLNKTIRFISSAAIYWVKADGHYTKIHNGVDELFCPLSISKLEKKLDPSLFVKTHRSYLVNRTKVTGFKRDGDKGICIINANEEIEVPISRSLLTKIRKEFNFT